MVDEQQRTLSEQRRELERQLRELEARQGVVVGDEYPITSEDRARQVDRLKEIIARIDEAQANSP